MAGLLGDLNAKLEVSVNTKSIIYIGLVITLAVIMGVFIGTLISKKL